MTEIRNGDMSEKILEMFNHKFNTQGVEVMNKLYLANTTKGATFSKTMSLTTRYQIEFGGRVLGHHALWT